ncbi:PD-(D/E)XK nuclease family protein [Microbacterium sp. ZW T5_56]|uniref:PD-(D/E)XK nuclease family protein n=1 Tax=Microbacterium sp. ZW T5_56 TaxID=3378081 RepID=UPI003852F055
MSTNTPTTPEKHGATVDSAPLAHKLDSRQSAVVALPATADAVVIGAPGTGKTTTLLARARQLLASGERGTDELLVLTPSRLTATRLRDDLGLSVGRATPGALARSLGSLAFQIVRAAMVRDGRPAPQLLTGADQDRIVADLLHGDEQDAQESGRSPRWPDELPAAARNAKAFRSELRTVIDECTELGLDPAELSLLGERWSRPVWTAAAGFIADYRDVTARMRAAHRDAADLLAEAAAIVRAAPSGSAALAALGPIARLKTVLIDDAQELTRGAIGLIEALRSRGVAVVAFGDPDIGSGAFRGVTPELFAQLAVLLGDVHVLDESHRATPAISRLMRVVTQAIGVGGRVEHRRAPGDELADPRVGALIAASPYEEADAIARTLRDWHLVSGVEWSRMAVIAHDTRQVSSLETELAAREVPTRAAGVQRPLGREVVVRQLLEVLELGIQLPQDRDPEKLAGALLSPFGGLDAVGLRRLRAALRHRELADGGTTAAGELLRSAFEHPLEFALLEGAEAFAAERLATTLMRVAEAYQRGETVHELLWLIWDRSRRGGERLADAWRRIATTPGPFAAETGRALDALVALFEAAKRAVERGTDADPAAFIRNLLGSDVPEDTLAAPESVQTVAVMTPATALGTEFDAVVIAGVQDGVWPNVRLRGGLLDSWLLADAVVAARAGDTSTSVPPVAERRRWALHDELRLFVRAVSRARTHLLVTAVDDDDTGPSALFGFLPEPSRTDDDRAGSHPLTLRGLVARYRRDLTAPITSSPQRLVAAGQLGALAAAGVPGAAPAQWYGLAPTSSAAPLRDPGQAPVPVSPSRMENFESCGVDWAIRSLGGDTRTSSQGLGTILHAAMEEVTDGDLAELQRVVDERWGELEFEAEWLSTKEKRWARTLVERLHLYLLRFRSVGAQRVGAEAPFELAIPLDEEAGAEHVIVRPLDAERAELSPGVPYAVLRGSIDRVEVYPPGAGDDIPQDPDRPGTPRAIVVDLKTGRSESRVRNDLVEDDAQLAAYQLAVGAGAIAGAHPDDAAGARLLVLSQTLKGTHWRIAHQAPLGPETADAFVQRVIADARGMASAAFTANIDQHCRVDRFAICGIHTVKAVSAS